MRIGFSDKGLGLKVNRDWMKIVIERSTYYFFVRIETFHWKWCFRLIFLIDVFFAVIGIAVIGIAVIGIAVIGIDVLVLGGGHGCMQERLLIDGPKKLRVLFRFRLHKP